IISRQDATFIKKITEVRNSLVHGVSMLVPKKNEIEMLIFITEKIKPALVCRLD
ncbi:hypothetical protein M1743_06360, partial [Salmonella enterica subsp. enterica serovar Saintpaul]|nr:hypothetical protein [Salmonella enterica subsp. enterica serovar Saintpaul]